MIVIASALTVTVMDRITSSSPALTSPSATPLVEGRLLCDDGEVCDLAPSLPHG